MLELATGELSRGGDRPAGEAEADKVSSISAWSRAELRTCTKSCSCCWSATWRGEGTSAGGCEAVTIPATSKIRPGLLGAGAGSEVGVSGTVKVGVSAGVVSGAGSSGSGSSSSVALRYSFLSIKVVWQLSHW